MKVKEPPFESLLKISGLTLTHGLASIPFDKLCFYAGKAVKGTEKEMEIILKCLWKAMKRIEENFDLTIGERHDILVRCAIFLQRYAS